MAYTNIAKPTGTGYTNISKPVGTNYSNLAKPLGSVIAALLSGMATGLIAPPTYAVTQTIRGSPYKNISKPT